MKNEMKERLREAFGKDSQKTVSEKLNITQGNVSKLLSGNQQPTLDTIKNISRVYDVSVDWLLGLSDVKNKTKSVFSYSNSVRLLLGMYEKGALELREDEAIILRDPLLIQMISKGMSIFSADRELYQQWIEGRLSIFDKYTIFDSAQWSEENISMLQDKRTAETEWIAICQTVEKQ